MITKQINAFDGLIELICYTVNITNNSEIIMSQSKNLMGALLNRRMLICIFNGFTAGLPLFFIYQFIPAWLRTEDVDLKTIGLFALVGIPYNWKFLWSPALDRYVPPFLGRRRGWMLIFQILLFIDDLHWAA